MGEDIVEKEIMARGYSDEYEKEYVRKDGTILPVSMRGWLIRDEKEKPIGMWVIVRDITERKRAEEELEKHREHLEELVKERTAELAKTNEKLEQQIEERKRVEEQLRGSELWLQSIFNSLEEAVFVVTPDRILVNSNAAAERMFGYSREELGNLSTEMVHVDHEHYLEFGRRIKEAFDQGKTANFEFKTKRKNGEVFPTEHTVSLLKSKQGKALGIVSVVRDNTERKQAVDALEKRTGELHTMLNAMAGREICMAELKETIRKLRAQLEDTGLTPVADDPLKEGSET